jgi:hypothetical protein
MIGLRRVMEESEHCRISYMKKNQIIRPRKFFIWLMLILLVSQSMGAKIAIYNLDGLSAGVTSVSSSIDTASQPTLYFPSKE